MDDLRPTLRRPGRIAICLCAGAGISLRGMERRSNEGYSDEGITTEERLLVGLHNCEPIRRFRR